MKVHHSDKRICRPVSLPGNRSSNLKSLDGSQARQLFRLENKVNESNRISQLARLQFQVNDLTSRKDKRQSNQIDNSSNTGTLKYVPSQKARIHIRIFPRTNKKLKGHFRLGNTDIKVSGYFSTLHALKALQSNPGIDGFTEMEHILQGWLDDFSPSSIRAPEELPVIKRPQYPTEEKKAETEK